MEDLAQGRHLGLVTRQLVTITGEEGEAALAAGRTMRRPPTGPRMRG